MRGGSARWQQIANEIPMPRVPSRAGAWILERLVLEPRDWQTNGAAVFDQALAVSGDEVSHRAAFPDVTVKPQTAFHRVDHPFTSKRELTVRAIVEGAVTIDRSAAHSRPEP